MPQKSVDGTLVVAKLKRNLPGGALYQDVTIRQRDGDHRRLGTLIVPAGIKEVMVPGSRGRFYVHDVLGTRGVHGFRASDGKGHACFPRRRIAAGFGIGILSLLVALFWLLLDGSFAFWATSLGLVGIAIGVIFLNTRAAAMKAYHVDDERCPRLAKLESLRA